MEIIQNNGKRIYLQLAQGGGTGAVSSVFGRSGDVIAQTDDYTAAQIENAVDTTQFYNNPIWLQTLAYSKITGRPILAPVATSGAYSDLTGKPTIPAQFNAIAGTGMAITGVYPNETFSASSLSTNTSMPKASDLGILANGTDQTSALNTVFSNANYKGIVVDYVGGGVITISGTLNCQNKIVQFVDGSRFGGSGTINNIRISAPLESQIFASTLIVNPIGLTGPFYSLMWSGAKGDGSTDDVIPMQRDIDNCVYNFINSIWIPPRPYKCSNGLLVRKDAGGRGSITTSTFIVGLSIYCHTGSYGATTGVPWINWTNANSFGWGFQKVKGLRAERIINTGVNTGLLSGTVYNFMQDPSYTFLSNGSRDNFVSPHIGANIDPLGSSATAMGDRYPDWTAYYTEVSHGGSTDVILTDWTNNYFTVGFGVSLNGFTQNGEKISFNNCWASYNKSCFATGQSQTRSVFINNASCWGGSLYIIDCRSYGNGTACPPEVTGINIAGGNRYYCNLDGNFSKGLITRGDHAELLWSLGGNLINEFGGELYIEDGFWDIGGPYPAASYFGGTSISTAPCMFQGGYLSIKNSKFTSFDAIAGVPFSIRTPQAEFTDTYLSTPLINNLYFNQTSYQNCNDNGVPFGDNMIRYSKQVSETSSNVFNFWKGMSWVINQPFPSKRTKIDSVPIPGDSFSVTLTSVTDSTLTAIFNLSTSSSHFKNLQVGDFLMYSVTDQFGNTGQIAIFGIVQTLNGGTGDVTIKATASGLTTTSYTITVYRPEMLIPPVIVGDIASTSNTITNVEVEGGINSIPIGVQINMPHFPAGTYIVSYTTGPNIITVSSPATLNESQVAIVSALWRGEYYNVADPAASGRRGYKIGDIVLNSRTDINSAITYWLCTLSGITGSTKQPTFQTYP